MHDVTFRQTGGNKTHQHIIDAGISFLLNTLFKKPPPIQFKIHLRTHRTMDPYRAFVEYTHSNFRRGNSYNIVIKIERDLCIEEQMLLLCHEMTHVKQLITGKLAYTYDEETETLNRTLWKGEDLTDLPYMDRPWEQEAIRNAPKLFRKLQQSAAMENCDWSLVDYSDNFFEVDPNTL